MKNGGVGGLQVNDEAAVSVPQINALQDALRTRTRLGIPASLYAETTHSGGFVGSTVFPMPVTSGASWNTTLLEQIGSATALELRSAGGDQGLGPILQVGRHAAAPMAGRGVCGDFSRHGTVRLVGVHGSTLRPHGGTSTWPLLIP